MAFKVKGDLSLVAYCDFETTVLIDSCLDPENFCRITCNKFGYSFGVIIERSFGHTLEKLTGVSCLTRDQLLFENPKTALQLKYCA